MLYVVLTLVLAAVAYYGLKAYRALCTEFPEGLPVCVPEGTEWLMGSFPVVVNSEVNANEYAFLKEQWLDKKNPGQMTFGFRLYLRTRLIFLFHPDDAHYALLQNLTNYVKGFEYAVLDPTLGKRGLVNIRDEAAHKHLRRAVNPAFRPLSLQAIASEVTSKHVTQHFTSLAEATPTDAWRTDYVLQPDLKKLTLALVCEAAFKTDNPDIGRQFETLQDTMFTNVLAALPYGTYIPTATNRRMLGARDRLREHARRIITSEREELRKIRTAGRSPPPATTLLDYLVRDPEDGCPGFADDDEVIDQCCTFLLAGHETTSGALEWFAYALAAHPADQEELFEEAESAFSLKAVPSLDTVLNHMPLLNRFMREVLRVWPPIPAVVRTAVADDVMPGSGQFIPAGVTIVVSPFYAQRLPLIWGDDADDFRPARWDEPHAAIVERAHKIVAAGGRSLHLEQTEACKLQQPPSARPNEPLAERIPRTSWMPFIAGHRSCIGRDFALHTSLITAAVMIRRLKWRVAANSPPPRRGYGTVMAPKPALHFDIQTRAK